MAIEEAKTCIKTESKASANFTTTKSYLKFQRGIAFKKRKCL